MSYKLRLKDTAFRNYLKTYAFECDDINADIVQYLRDCKVMLEAVLECELEQLDALKFWLCAKVEYCKRSDRDDKKTCYFPNRQCTLMNPSQIKEQVAQSLDKMREEVEMFESNGSDWIVVNVMCLELHCVKYQPLRGSSFVDLPIHIRRKHAVINIQNPKDNECFKWCLLAHLHPAEHHPDRVSHYRNIDHGLNFDGMDFPLPLHQIDQFCRQNSDMSINVYSCDGPLRPLRITDARKETHVNLLYYKGHYSLIKHFDRLMGDQNKHRARKYFCDICLFAFNSAEKLQEHAHRCTNPTLSRTEMPTESSLSFSNYKKKIRRSLVVYADFECLLSEVSSCSPDPSRSFTEKIQRHVPCAMGAVSARSCCNNQTTTIEPYRSHTGPGCVRAFLAYLTEMAKDLSLQTQAHRQPNLTADEERIFNSAEKCWICEKNITAADRVRDHCHTCGKFRGAAHAECNSKLQVDNEVTVIFHNLRRYDGHILIREIGEICAKSPELRIGCIAKSSEDYISFNVSKRGAKKRLADGSHRYDPGFKITFIDSVQFLSASLEGLVKDLPPDSFRALEENFPADKVHLLKRKGVFPYDYLCKWDRLKETVPPKMEDFSNKLTCSEISQLDYQHMLNVWDEFGIQTLGEYMELYLKTDTLLLCDVFEGFRTFALSSFGLDPCHYFTLPGFGWDACLKFTNVELELLSDPDMYAFFESAVRGGISIICQRQATANNPYIEEYDPNQLSSYIVYLDENNLYGWSMMQKLPHKDFAWMNEEEVESFDVNAVDPDGDTGYLLEVDLEYPEDLHDRHNGYPLAPERLKVEQTMLSPYSLHVLGDSKHVASEKLVPNLHAKSHYVLHMANLKFYLKEGMRLKKIHRGIKFTQSAWMIPYIDFNTQRRREAVSKFIKNLHKLLNNAVFGKTMENVRKYMELELVTSQTRLLKVVKKPEFDRSVIFSENLAACIMHRATVQLNKPIYTGVVVLDLSKLLMYKFHYEQVIPRYGARAKLLMSDTDSFIYHIQTEDVYRDMESFKDEFDTSGYPDDHFLQCDQNKSVVGKMKDETGGKPITDFVGLRAKMYSFRCNGEEHKRAKGITRNVVQRDVSFADYARALQTGVPQYHEMRMIRSFLHELYTVRLNKRSLASFDDKRFVLGDGVSTLAHGHWRIASGAFGTAGQPPPPPH